MNTGEGRTDVSFSDVSIIIPWRGSGPQRVDALRVVQSMLTAMTDAQVIVARMTDDSGPWRKAEAIMNGLRASDRQYVVMHDADVVVHPEDIRRALGAVRCEIAAWGMPHRLNHRLTEQATKRVMRVADEAMALDVTSMHGVFEEIMIEASEPASLEQVHPGHAGGGIVVMRRSLLVDIPPDIRFAGWGQEDDAWAHALTTLVGPPHRGEAPLYHLWHPPQTRMDRVRGSRESMDLYWRYTEAAKGGWHSMRALVNEAREAQGS